MYTPWEVVPDQWKVELKYLQPPGSSRLRLEQHWSIFYSVFQSSPRSLASIFHSINLLNIIPLFFGGWGMYNNFSVFPASHFAFLWIICKNKLYPPIINVSSHSYYSVASFMYNIQITTELQGWLHKFCSSVQNENSEPFVQKAKKKKVPLKLLKCKTFFLYSCQRSSNLLWCFLSAI